MHSFTKFLFLATLPILVGTMSILLLACSPKASEVVVATVGARAITLPEYENLYIKSNGGSREQAASSTQEERAKFLGLMTKFRLKLTDAYERGLDKTSDVQKEIAQYRGSLASAYLTERDITTPGIRKLYQHRTEEIRASHILLTLSPNASPADSLRVYQKANEIITALKAGGNFAALALENSQDPSAKQNKGDLYYFSGGRMVPSFEDAVFAMKAGELTPTPIRTTYGLHIVKVMDRKPSSGEIRCSHIMIRFDKQEPTPEDTLAAYRKIKAIQDSLIKGIDFAGLARRNSEDPGSSGQGGDLNWFSRGRWVLPFDEIAFGLKPSQVSGIVRTAYGYHLIKCYDARSLKSFDEMKKELQPIYQQQRFQNDYQKYLSRLKQELKFTLRDSILAHFIATLDSNKTTKDSAWAAGASAALGKQTVMSFGERSVSVDSAVALIGGRPDFNNTPLRPPAVRSAFDKVAEQLAFTIKGESLERQDSAFAQIMKEYAEGILLYQVEQDQVWNRIAVSDSASKAYFNAHRDRFTYPDRVRFSEIRAANDSLAKIIYARLAKGESYGDVVASDSARMNAPLSLTLVFAKNSTKISARSEKALAKITQELKSDAALKMNVTMHPDTTGKKMAKLASDRLDAIRSLLVKRLGAPDSRVVTLSQPPTRAPSKLTKAEKDSVNSTVHVVLVGRLPIVQGRVATELLPVAADERARRADSLSIGQYSKPFENKRLFSIVRLDGREAAREKTYEEAGTEVSSAFQEYELKRLESEWLEGLKKSHPVVEHPEVLKNAFVSAH